MDGRAERRCFSPSPRAIRGGLCVQRWLYANFGVTRNWLGNKLGWWGGYDHYSGDAELSLKIWDAGYKVVKLDGNGHILHLEVQDSTRKGNNDSEKFYAKWNDWEGPSGIKILQ